MRIKKVVRRLSYPLRLKPEARWEEYTKSHLEKGSDYHDRFESLPGRKYIWELEKSLLLRIANETGPIKRHLDFAGGTGRIAGVLEDIADQQIVLDVSDKMLMVARDQLKKAEVICDDFNNRFHDEEMTNCDLITAFRFFPNAEPTLRDSAMKFIAKKLSNSGILICNNHRNFWSIPYFFRRVTFRGGTFGMTNKEIINLAAKYNLRLIKVYSMGILPQTEKYSILPWKVTNNIERNIFTNIGDKHRKGYNVIYIFSK